MNTATRHLSTGAPSISHARPFHFPRSRPRVSTMSRQGQECPGQDSAPECLQSPQSLVPRGGLGSMLLGTGRGKGFCCSALLASVRLGEQAQLLGGPGGGPPLKWLHQLLAARCSAVPTWQAPKLLLRLSLTSKLPLVQGTAQSWPAS